MFSLLKKGQKFSCKEIESSVLYQKTQPFIEIKSAELLFVGKAPKWGDVWVSVPSLYYWVTTTSWLVRKNRSESQKKREKEKTMKKCSKKKKKKKKKNMCGKEKILKKNEWKTVSILEMCLDWEVRYWWLLRWCGCLDDFDWCFFWGVLTGATPICKESNIVGLARVL